VPLTDTEIANIKKLVEQSRLTEVVIQQNGKRAIFSSRETAPKLAKPFAIVAPQTGTITFESLEIDQAVETGDVLAHISVLNDETLVRAPRAGRIASILVSDGALVNYGTGLMQLHPKVPA